MNACGRCWHDADAHDARGCLVGMLPWDCPCDGYVLGPEHDCEAVVRDAALARREAEDAAWRAEQERRADLRVAARSAATAVVRTVTDGTWRVLAGDVVLGSLTRTTRETRSGGRRVVVEVIVVGDDWITRDVGIRGGIRYLAFSAALRAHGSAPCHDESLVDAIEARVRIEQIA